MKKSHKLATLLVVVTILFSSCLGDDAYSTEPIFIIDPVEPQDTAIIARSGAHQEPADTVHKVDNTIMTPDERIELQTQINYGNPNPPEGGRIPNHH